MKFRVVLLLVLLTATRLAAAEAAKVAVIADAAAAKQPLAALIEQELAHRKDLALLERETLRLAVDEAALQRLAGDDRGQRMAALRALKVADALVVLRQEARSTQLTLCDTRRGLRLMRISIPSDKPAEVSAGAAASEIAHRLVALSRPEVQIWAVPPLVDRNLTSDHGHLKGSLARLIEEHLAARGDVLCVELAEARALADEIALGGADVRRELPYYVLGEFRHASRDAEATVDLTLELQQGARSLHKIAPATIPPDQLASTVTKHADTLLEKAGSAPLARPVDPASEAAILARRATTFSTLSSYEEPIALIEAAILLQPQNDQIRRDALSIYGRQIKALVESHTPRPGRTEKEAAVLAAVPLHQRSIEHLVVVYSRLLDERKDDNVRSTFSRDTSYWIRSLSRSERDFPTPAMRDAVRQLNETERELLIPLVARELATNERSWLVQNRNAFWQDGDREPDGRIDRVLAIARRLPDEPEMGLRVFWLVHIGFALNYTFDDLSTDEIDQRLAPARTKAELIRTLPQKNAPAWAGYVRQKLDERKQTEITARAARARRIAEAASRPVTRPAATDPATMAKLTLTPIDLKWPADVQAAIRPESQIHWLTTWVPVSKSRAIIGRPDQLLWLDGLKQVRPLKLPNGAQAGSVRTDGRHIWFSGYGKAGGLFVGDARTEQIKQVLVETLFPPFDRGLIVVPVGGGRAVAVGAFGGGQLQPARTWIAVLTVAADLSVSAEMAHEAMDLPPDRSVAARQPLVNEAFVPSGAGAVWTRDGQITHVQVGGHRIFDVEKRTLHTVQPIFNLLSAPALHEGSVWYLKTPGSSIDTKPLQLIRRAPDGQVTVEIKALPFNGFKLPTIEMYKAGDWFIMRREKRFWACDIATRQIAEFAVPPQFAPDPNPDGTHTYSLRWLEHDGQVLAVDPFRWELHSAAFEMPEK